MRFVVKYYGWFCLCLINVTTLQADETCSWKPDGTKVCTDPEKGHNVWTAELDEDSENTHYGEPAKEISSLEKAFFDLFVGQFKDGKHEEIVQFSPEIIILSIVNVFNSFDSNEDGVVDYAELERTLSDRSYSGSLETIKEDITNYPENRISIFDFLGIFKKFNDGKETIALLLPFEKLKFLPPGSAKKIIQGSVQMFVDSDQNSDSKLNKDEFSLGMQKAQEKRKKLGAQGQDATLDQLDALFTLVDKDNDDHLTYLEFQGTIPDKPKTFEEAMDEVFKDADSNSDGSLSEEEFATYMEIRSKKENQIHMPTSKEITDAFEKLDVNGDNLLSMDEMMGMFEELNKAKEQRIVEAFRGFDKDFDGVLSKNELQAIVDKMQESTGDRLDVNVFMTMLDKNGDKKVSIDEMTVLMNNVMK